jgi:hypothetical protein
MALISGRPAVYGGITRQRLDMFSSPVLRGLCRWLQPCVCCMAKADQSKPRELGCGEIFAFTTYPP